MGQIMVSESKPTAQSSSSSFGSPKLVDTLALLRREVIAAISVACVTLPVCLSAGLVVYAPLGGTYVSQGAAAGLYGAVFAGVIAAFVASSSFIVTTPLASASVILAALATYLMGEEQFAAHPQWIVVAIALCVLIAGLFQVLFGLLNIARTIKFTPHPVIAGFLNSVALLIILSQLRKFIEFDSAFGHWIRINRPTMLIFVLALAAAIVFFGNWTKKVPAPLAGLVVGSGLFYLVQFLLPGLALGPTLGDLTIQFPPRSPILDLGQLETRSTLISVGPHLLLTALTLAAVATLQSLLTFRVAQTLGALPPRPARDLIGQGVGNCASALAGGIVALPNPSALTTCFRAGGRTRMAAITSAVLFLLIGLFLSQALGAIPVVVLFAILVSIGIQLFDRWSFRLLGDVVRNRQGIDRRHAWQSLSVVAMVMLVTMLSSIVVGAVAGFVLSCLIFIVRMSRPIVRRHYRGNDVFSKRVRSEEDMAILLRSGRRRAVLELQGVLFFGNADDLSRVAKDVLEDSDMILFDCRGISDMDVSGETILGNLVSWSRQRGKVVLFCNVPANRITSWTFAKEANAILPDIDTALEWMEEKALDATAQARSRGRPIPIASIDLVKDLTADELDVLLPLLTRRDFPAGAVICSEGEEADRMWVLTKGSVSVRLHSTGEHESRRIDSMAAGTTVGEMALLTAGRRSATVVADEEVLSYELSRAALDTILQTYPQIAVKLLTYFAREMIRRLRINHQELRTLTG